MGGIFISYRREDAAADAGRLYDDLRRRYGKDVFVDVSMQPGVDFHHTIFDKIATCDVLLALIGPRWVQARDEVTRQRRLDEETDYVRQEIQTALSTNKLVIPVLLPGVKMPRAEDLPTSIRDLARRNAFEFRYERWSTDLDHLVEQLRGAAPQEQEAAATDPWKRRSYVVATAVGLLLAVHVFSVYTLGVDPHYVAAGTSFVLGLATTLRFRFSILEELGIALSVSVLVGIASSILVALLSGQNIVPEQLVEVRLTVTFVASIFVGYLIGMHAVDLYRNGEQALRNRRRSE
jgi:hypothetical protein